MDADGSDFFLRNGAARDGPDAGSSGDPLGGNAEAAAGADEGFFKVTDVIDGAESRGEAMEIDDGVADELTGAVISNVASAVDFVDLDATVGEKIIRRQDVVATRVTAEGKDRRMLEEQEGVSDAACMAGLDELLLKGERGGVVDSAKMDEVEDHLRCQQTKVWCRACP